METPKSAGQDDIGDALPVVAEVHDRMPVLLTPDQFMPWLNHEAGADYLKPAPKDYLQRWPVSKRSKADADDAALIDKVA
jgi:putative SOS response-associated peptidase YedK